jgi:nucleotide-binding universal stress UspA family protein
MEYNGKYIVCVDGSAASRVALHFACKKAAKRGGVVEMLHVIPPADMQNMFGVLEKAREEQRSAANELTASLSASAVTYSGITPKVLIREGRLGDEVLNAVLEDPHIDMIMLGVSSETEGGGKLLLWLAGKLGDKLLVPILLVPGNLTDLQIEELS